MKYVLFVEGNGLGHAARDLSLIEAIHPTVISFGRAAKFIKKRTPSTVVELPMLYKIVESRASIDLITNPKNFVKSLMPKVRKKWWNSIMEADTIISDGTMVGVVLAYLLGKDSILIANDLTSKSFLYGLKKLALPLVQTLIGYNRKILIPDFPPPLTVSRMNIGDNVADLPLTYIGPTVSLPKQKRHKKDFVVLNYVEKYAKHIKSRAVFGSDVDVISKYIGSAKLVIGHGGHSSIMEALSMGKPYAAIVNRNYSERIGNVAGLDEECVGSYIYEDEASFGIEALIEKALTSNSDRLKAYKRLAKKLNERLDWKRLLR